MTTALLTSQIASEESLVLTAYPDVRSALAVACRANDINPIHYTALNGWAAYSGAPWTIGYGHTGREVHPGLVWTAGQAVDALVADIQATETGLDSALPWWRNLDDVRQDALCDMAFNMGVHKLMGFTHMLAALQSDDWQRSHDQALASAWAGEVGDRAIRDADMFLTGMRAAA